MTRGHRLSLAHQRTISQHGLGPGGGQGRARPPAAGREKTDLHRDRYPLDRRERASPGSGRISLRTLVPIRWVAIAGQALAILSPHAHYGLGFHLPLAPALAVVAGSVLLNLVLIVYRQVARRLGERYASLCLGYDILQLAILLYLTGGLQNPSLS